MLRFRSLVRVPYLVGLVSVLAMTFAGVASAEFPTMRRPPSIIGGPPQEGQTLQGQTGQWLMATGLNCPDCRYRYTWQRCNADASGCSDIPGATGMQYTLTSADVGKRIRFVEWVSKHDCNQAGTECRDVERNAVSDLTVVVTPKAVATAQATAAPAIDGVAMEDEVLRARSGTWTGPQPITLAFQWQRCDVAVTSCANIAGATAPTYRLTPGDVGARVRVVQIASNPGGSASSASAPTAIVSELRPTAARPAISVTRVALPHRLIIDRFAYVARTNTVRFRISDDRGFRIIGALVRAAAVSGGRIVPSREVRTGADGWASFKVQGSGTVAVYVTARKSGEKLQTGVSTSTLFKFRVRAAGK